MNSPYIDLISEIRELVAEDKISEALTKLKESLPDIPQANEVYLQSGRYTAIKESIRQGVVEDNIAEIKLNKIRRDLLELLQELEQGPRSRHTKPENTKKRKRVIFIVLAIVLLIVGAFITYWYLSSSSYSFNLNKGKAIFVQSNQTIQIEQTDGRKLEAVFVAIDRSFTKLTKSKACDCWTLNLQEFRGLADGKYEIAVGPSKEYVNTNWEKIYESITIDNQLPNAEVIIEKDFYDNDSLDLHIRGATNEKVNVEIDIPSLGKTYQFSSKLDTQNIYSFSYEILDVDIIRELNTDKAVFSIKITDEAGNEISHAEDENKFFSEGKSHWSFKGKTVEVDKEIQEFPQMNTSASNTNANPLASSIPPRKLILTVKIISSHELNLSWDLLEERENVDYTVFRDGEVISKTSEKSLTDDKLERDKAYKYYVEATDTSGIIARSPLVKQETWIVVAKDGTGDYSTIQEGVNASQENGTVYVKNGIYSKTSNTLSIAYLNKSINLLGEDPVLTIIDASYYNYGIHITSKGKEVIIQNLTIRNAGRSIDIIGHGIRVESYNRNVTENKVRVFRTILNNCESGIDIYSSIISIANTVIINTKGRGFSAVRSSAYTEYTDLTISKSIIVDNDGSISSSERFTKLSMNQNIFWNNREGLSDAQTSSCIKCIFEEPIFSNKEEGNFRLVPFSVGSKLGIGL